MLDRPTHQPAMIPSSDEQEMLRNIARTWAQNESPVSAWRKMRDAENGRGYEPATYAAMAELGWTGIVLGEEFGGSDLGWSCFGIVVEELGRTLVASPLVASTLAGAAIAIGGDAAQKARWLPQLARGELVAALAIDEGPRHEAEAQDAIATRVENGRIHGRKAFVAEGGNANVLVVVTTSGLHLVAADDPAVIRERRDLVDRRDCATIAFGGASAEALACAGEDLLPRLLDIARAITAAEMLGMASAAFEITLGYLKQRVQFGRTLASFQALQHRMAALFMEIELTRSVVESALAALDANDDTARASALAKARANDCLHLVTNEMTQLHGGIALTDEHDAGLFLKRARVLEQSWGRSSYLRDLYGRRSGC